ncbi:MAG TPA: diaminopimelate epimerase [Bryobacteraceae bacterium]|nr:diaminopimelate epimerase [Bryobacteraceae bacterium]
MTIPFVKAHGAGNDFLLSWAEKVAVPEQDLPASARAICDRHTGIGADGWMLIQGNSIRLFNSDGSEPEMSGNGTRCAAALLIDVGRAGDDVTIQTGAGPKHLRLLERNGRHFVFEMNMGSPSFETLTHIPMVDGPQEVTILNVGNPQCVVFVDQFPANWESLGAEIESHPRFPQRTNVSFVRVIDPHTIETRFYERGAGVTLSSGTGSTGAGAAAILRKVVESPVTIRTPAGEVLQLRWEDSIYLTGPAEIVGSGEFYLERRF